MRKKPESESEKQKQREREIEAARRTERANLVELAAAGGLTPEGIGLLFVPPVTGAEIEAQFAKELELGPARQDFKTVSMLLGAINKGNVTAMIYYTKARMGWTERGPSLPKMAEAEDKATDEPAKMPSGREISEKILPFQARSSRKFSE